MGDHYVWKDDPADGFTCMLFSAGLAVLSILHIWLVTVVLGSILFVTLADMLTVVEALVSCALPSRIVLAFELHGIKQVSSAELLRYYSVDAETLREVKRDAGGGAEELEPMRFD